MLKLYMLGLVRLDLVRFDGILFCFSQADSCSKGVILDMVVPAAMPTPWRQILRFMVQLSSLMLNKASWAWSWLIRLGFYYVTVTKPWLKKVVPAAWPSSCRPILRFMAALSSSMAKRTSWASVISSSKSRTHWIFTRSHRSNSPTMELKVIIFYVI